MSAFFPAKRGERGSEGIREYPYRGWEDVYRDKWKWDKVVRGSHAVDCYPSISACPYWVYLRQGEILFQEQSGSMPEVEEGVPDFNPMGCQKGACFHQFLDQRRSRERVLYPLKRAGERGSGRWQRISWDQALTEIADGILDALQEAGPESIFSPGGCNALAWGLGSQRKFSQLIAAVSGDFDVDMSDFPPGMVLTWGKKVVSSEDDRTHAQLIFITNMNPHYTRIPYAHFLSEARYKGAEVVLLAPDYSPSAMHVDYHVPLRVGSDAALWLGICKVVVDEGLVDWGFVKDQTDLPLLVRLDDRRFLRASDVEEAGRDDQFYFYDSKAGRVVEAPRGTLALEGIDPALEGSFSVSLKDGRRVEVTPVFELLKEKLREYEPEKASALCGVHPEVIRMLGRKVGSKRTSAYEGLGGGKHYHSDLMERAMYLALALTGNWGKKGAGPTFYAPGVGGVDVSTLQGRPGGIDELRRLVAAQKGMLDTVKAQDPTMTDEIAATLLVQQFSAAAMTIVPPTFATGAPGRHRRVEAACCCPEGDAGHGQGPGSHHDR